MSQVDPAAEFDSPAERQARQYKAAQARISRVLESPDWKVLIEFLQARFRDRLAVVLESQTPADIEEARADMRAILRLGTEFGTADLRIAGNLANLESMITDSRRSIAAQLGIPGGDDNEQA